MRNRDLDKNVGMGRSDMSSARKRPSSRRGHSSDSSRSSERMRNREDSASGMSESSEDLQRLQSEGNLGNERVRDK